MPPANTGYVYELSDGTFGVQYRLPDGSRRRRSGFKNRTEARRWHADNVLPVVHGRRRLPDDLTLRGLVDLYVERHEHIRSPRTLRTLRERLARPLERFGDARLEELETMALELAGWRSTLPPRYAHSVMGARCARCSPPRCAGACSRRTRPPMPARTRSRRRASCAR